MTIPMRRKYGLTYEQATTWLKTITYKPNWGFHIRENNGFLQLHTQFRATDAVTGKGELEIQANYLIPEIISDPHEFLRWVRSVIRELEFHELDEWLKVDGVAVFYPHKETP